MNGLNGSFEAYDAVLHVGDNAGEGAEQVLFGVDDGLVLDKLVYGVVDVVLELLDFVGEGLGVDGQGFEGGGDSGVLSFRGD